MNHPDSSERSRSDFDTLLHILSNERRRLALQYACEHGATTTSELADQLAHLEAEKHPDNVRSQERKRVYIALYQNHLPKLADGGFITYQNHRVEVQPLAHEVWAPLHALETILNNPSDPTPESQGLGLREKLHAITHPTGGDPA